MSEYLLTGRDRRGKTVTESVDADSADGDVQVAREQLGLDNVVLHTDDAGALYARKVEGVSPGDSLRLRNLPRPIGIFLLVAKLAHRRLYWVMLLAAGILAYRRWVGRPWNMLDWLEVGLFFTPWMAVVQHMASLKPGDLYHRLNDAIAWGRWQEALNLTDQLREEKVAPEELAFRRATALAGLGRLDEGLAVVAPFGDGRAMPEWLYHDLSAELYLVAGRITDVRSSLERALELAPDNPTVMLDVARSDVRYGGDPRRARVLLTLARKHVLSDMIVPYAVALEGRILLAEGRSTEAIPLLEDAHRGFGRTDMQRP